MCIYNSQSIDGGGIRTNGLLMCRMWAVSTVQHLKIQKLQGHVPALNYVQVGE